MLRSNKNKLYKVIKTLTELRKGFSKTLDEVTGMLYAN